MRQPNGKPVTTSKLLIEEEPLQVLPALAVALGLNEAIALQQLHYWLRKKPHHRAGRDWHYNRYVDWQQQFPFWSISTIKRTMVSLEKSGVVSTANYNNSPIDKTKWYSINYDKLNSLHIDPTAQVDPSTAQVDPSTAQVDPSTAQNDPTTAQNEPLHGSSWSHQSPETNTETTDRDLPPPYSPSPPDLGGVESPLDDRCAASYNQPLKEEGKTVLTYLNQVTGCTYTNLAFITALLETDATVADCKLVIDWWQVVKIVEQPGQRVNFNASTPFKRHLFAEYLPLAKQWDEQGRHLDTQKTAVQQREAAAIHHFREHMHGTPARHGRLHDRDEDVIDGLEYRVDD